MNRGIGEWGRQKSGPKEYLLLGVAVVIAYAATTAGAKSPKDNSGVQSKSAGVKTAKTIKPPKARKFRRTVCLPYCNTCYTTYQKCIAGGGNSTTCMNNYNYCVTHCVA